MPQTAPNALRIDYADLERIMPFYLALSASGEILSAGPTLRKMAPDLVGKLLLDRFQIKRPANTDTFDSFKAQADQKLQLTLRDDIPTELRGIGCRLQGGGLLLNLSLGIDLAESVEHHQLSDADFAPTDLAVEMLYLLEVKNLVMTELQALNDRLRGEKRLAERQAQTDTLTGLLNRRALEQQLNLLALGARPFGLLHLDLDYFKAVNDSLGHAAGDLVLEHVAQRLTQETRKRDIIARVGGDEFILIFPDNTCYERLTEIAKRIILCLQQPIFYHGTACKISASIGIAISTEFTLPLENGQLLAAADAALYASKRNGRGRVTISASQTTPKPRMQIG